MRHFFAVIALLCITTTAYSENLLIVAEPWEPYVIQRGNNLYGTDHDIAVAILEKLGHTVTVEAHKWKRALFLTRTLRADVILDASSNAERQQQFYYTTEPISCSTTCLFYRNDLPIEYNGIESLTGLRVGLMAGYSYGDEFDNATNFTRDEVHSLESNFKKLMSGRVDVIVENRAVGLHKARNMGLAQAVSPCDNNIIDGRPLYVAFSRKKGHDVLARQFSIALRKFKQTKNYEILLAKYGVSKQTMTFCEENLPNVN